MPNVQTVWSDAGIKGSPIFIQSWQKRSPSIFIGTILKIVPKFSDVGGSLHIASLSGGICCGMIKGTAIDN